MLVDLDAWYKDQKKYEAEGNGDPASPLPGMVYRPKAAGEYKPMAWPAFRVFNMTSSTVLYSEYVFPEVPHGALLMTGD